MRFTVLSLAAELLFVSSVSAGIFPVGNMSPPAFSLEDALLEGTSIERRGTHVATFQQLIDHDNPSLGTFSQRYWWNDDYYGGPGSPVMLFNPGEEDASAYTGYLSNRTVTGAFMKTNRAAGIMIEHRYWGQSSPYPQLTVENLQQLTLKNSIQDMVYFAKNVRPPYDLQGSSSADKAPWILSGCSYSGALTGWVNSLAPGTFWAYHGSSAVVQTITNLWSYYGIIEEAMPRNCSKDVQKAVKYIDKILTGDDAKAKAYLKTRFGLADLEDDDFVSGIVGGMTSWQGTSFYAGYNPFHQFCDYVENQWPGSNATAPGPEGVGLCKAVSGYAKWSREISVPGACANYKYWAGNKTTTACFGTHDKTNPLYTDTGVDNQGGRQWMWMLCNEPFEYWQVHHNGADNNIVSSIIQPNYWSDQCESYFPSRGQKYTYGINKGFTAEDVDRVTGGWNHVNTTRFTWTNGELDPWRGATVSSDNRPGGPLKSTEEVPVHVIPKSAHCMDMLTKNAEVNEGLKEVYDAEIAQIQKWVSEYYTLKGIKQP